MRKTILLTIFSASQRLKFVKLSRVNFSVYIYIYIISLCASWEYSMLLMVRQSTIWHVCMNCECTVRVQYSALRYNVFATPHLPWFPANRSRKENNPQSSHSHGTQRVTDWCLCKYILSKDFSGKLLTNGWPSSSLPLFKDQTGQSFLHCKHISFVQSI